jgi:hypothetical protein
MADKLTAAETHAVTPAYTPRPLRGFKLIGEDGNAFSIMGRFKVAAQRAKLDKTVIDAVLADSRSGDYDHLLGVFMAWSSD